MKLVIDLEDEYLSEGYLSNFIKDIIKEEIQKQVKGICKEALTKNHVVIEALAEVYSVKFIEQVQQAME